MSEYTDFILAIATLVVACTSFVNAFKNKNED